MVRRSSGILYVRKISNKKCSIRCIFLLLKNCKNGYSLTSKSRIAKVFPRLSSGGFWKDRCENWAELQTYLRRDIRPSGKSDFTWSTSACFPVFIQSGIYFPPPAKGWRSPFLSRTGNLRAPAPINSNSFCEIALFIFSSILISSSKNVYLLFYAIPRRIVNR